MIWQRRHFLYQNILNGVVFYVYWGLCIYYATNGDGLTPVLMMIPVTGIHFVGTTRVKREVRLLIVAAFIGTLLDTCFQLIGAVKFKAPYPTPFAWIAPAWITCLHANFAMTLYHSLRWLHPRPWLASVLGGIGAAFTYATGLRFGAAELPWGMVSSLALIGAVWAIYLPGLYLSKL